MHQPQKKGPRILFLTSNLSSFVEGDLRMLRERYPVREVIVGGNPIQSLTQRLSLGITILSGVLGADMTVSWFAHNHAYLAVMVSRLLGKRSLVVIGGYEVAREPDVGYGALLDQGLVGKIQYVIENADCILAVSEFSKREILQVARPRRIETVYNSVDTSVFYPEDQKENVVLTVCLVSAANIKVKGLDTFIEAARHFPEAQFVLLGRALDDAIEILRQKSPENVEFIEPIGQDEIIWWYRRAKVYCQLSYRESFGVALAEAMSCECVPVVTDRGALPEVVGDTGFVVPYGDAEATAAAIVKALQSDGGRAARVRVEKEFSLQERMQKIRSIIEERPV